MNNKIYSRNIDSSWFYLLQWLKYYYYNYYYYLELSVISLNASSTTNKRPYGKSGRRVFINPTGISDILAAIKIFSSIGWG